VLTSGQRDTIASTVSHDGTAAGVAMPPQKTTVATGDYLSSNLPVRFDNTFVRLLLGASEGFSGMVWKRSGEGKSIGEFVPQGGNAEGTLAGLAIQKDEPVPALFRAGKIGLLPKPEGVRIAAPMAVNGEGIAVGAAMTSEQKIRPVGWSKGRTGFLPVPGNRQGMALGINAQKVVVGVIETEDGKAHAALWKDGKVADLNDLFDKDSGWTLIQARGINSKGQIVGTAIKENRVAAFVLGCP
jgi:probable HAF family extracellular repeat protein